MIPSNLSPDFFRILTALTKLVVLAMLLERALIIIFDYRWFSNKLSSYGFKTPIAFLVSWTVCSFYRFDVLGALFEGSSVSPMGIFVTAAIVAGGSAGAITLFQGVLRFSKSAQDQMKDVQKAQNEADLAEAKARKAEAEAKAKQ
jgi:hypothetical protein